MKPSFNRRSYVVLGLGLLVTLALGSQFSQQRELVALAAGYILFALNYLLIASLYRSLLLSSRIGGGSPRFRLLITLGSGLKFVGLIGALYILLVLWALPGFYLAAGSLISLFILTWILMLSYLRTLSASQGP